MNQQLARLLGSQGALFERLVADLERATGNCGYDVALVGENLTSVGAKLAQLGFDFQRANRADLEEVLRVKVSELEREFTSRNPRELLKEIIAGVKVWEISDLALERIKNVNRELISGSADRLDSAKIRQQIAGLERGYFEFNQLRVAETVTDPLFADFRAVLALPDSSFSQFVATLAEVYQRVLFSNQLALAIYNHKLTDFLLNQTSPSWTLAGSPVPSDAIYANLAKQNSLLHDQLTKNHPGLASSLSDTSQIYQKTIALLGDDFWQPTEKTILIAQPNLSFNLFDRVLDATKFAEQALWQEFLGNYLTSEGLRQQILLQIQPARKTKNPQITPPHALPQTTPTKLKSPD